jgi:hypothetical protein
MGVYAPELLILYALDMFLVLSIVTCLFDSHFPVAVPYFFQLLAIGGTGHMYLSRVFEGMFTVESRFLYSVFYLGAYLASSFAVSAYLFLVNKSTSKGLMFFGGCTFPSTVFGAYVIRVFKNELPIPWFLSSDFATGWMSVMLLFSFMLLFAGMAMFFDPDQRSLSSFRQSIAQFIIDLLSRDKRYEEEEAFEEPDYEYSDEEYLEEEYPEEYNPVDFVRVHRIEQEDYEGVQG